MMIDFISNENNNKFIRSVLEATLLVGYKQVMNNSLDLISQLPGVTDDIIKNIKIIALEQGDLPTQQSANDFFNFILFGKWQDAGLDPIIDFSYEQRAAIVNCIKTASDVILQGPINELQSYVDAVLPELPESEPE